MPIPAAPITSHLVFMCPPCEARLWPSPSKPRVSRSLRVFDSAVLCECVTLALRAGLEKTMAKGCRVIGGNKGLYHLSDVVGATPICYPFRLEIIRRCVTKPLRREHTSVRPPKELSRREGNYGRRGPENPSKRGLPLVRIPDSWQSAMEMAPSIRDRHQKRNHQPMPGQQGASKTEPAPIEIKLAHSPDSD